MSTLSPAHDVAEHSNGSLISLTWRIAQSAAKSLTASDATEATMSLTISRSFDGSVVAQLKADAGFHEPELLAVVAAETIDCVGHLGLWHVDIPGMLVAVFDRDARPIYVRCDVAREAFHERRVMGGRYELVGGRANIPKLCAQASAAR